MLLEALLVAVLGTVPGLLIGTLLTPVFAWLLRRNGLAPDEFTASPNRWVLARASGVAVVVALLAARSASRRAAKVRPVVAAAEAGADTRRPGVFRLLFGLVCLAGAAIIPFALPSGLEVVLAAAVMLSWLALIGLSALGPILVLRVAGALLWLGSVPGRLVGRPAPLGELPRASSRRAARRTTAIAMPVAVCVGLAATLLGITGMAVAGSGKEAASLVTADHVVLAGPAGTIDAAVARSFAELAGVTAAVPMRRTEVMAGSRAETYERPAWLVDSRQFTQVATLPVSAGDVRGLRPGTVALGGPLAKSMGGLAVGDTARFWGPDGEKVEATVVALLDLPMLSVEALLPFPGDVVADQVLISFDRGLCRNGADESARRGRCPCGGGRRGRRPGRRRGVAGGRGAGAGQPAGRAHHPGHRGPARRGHRGQHRGDVDRGPAGRDRDAAAAGRRRPARPPLVAHRVRRRPAGRPGARAARLRRHRLADGAAPAGARTLAGAARRRRRVVGGFLAVIAVASTLLGPGRLRSR